MCVHVFVCVCGMRVYVCVCMCMCVHAQGPLTPAAVQALDRAALRGCGLSERKADYLVALADMFASAHEHLDDQHIQVQTAD
jgi:3-methyladenine DNA glycosylase/8-oxoguanine DNA glycosylase